ncbi:hypothetical protein [Gloeothece verrucosa]|uniref:Uncharacterized protein n=1 Tax=Gloeothece verrucosa (strain PCC 7822) TaxID=497965 RepID=E0U5X7_GLOV7|nr:hypothetical protein [Gloeothece verrucosa]ADN17086.1 hypothetical protein Cyan7822_5204 [Gloeothece verrucosa PCC 7822]
MLLVLDPSLINEINNKKVQIVFELIAQSRCQGNHIVISDRNTLNCLKKCDFLSSVAQMVYTQLYSDLPDFSVYLENLKNSILIVLDDVLEFQANSKCELTNGTITLEPRDGFQVIKASYRYFSYGSFTPTILLTENRIDGEIYHQITKLYNKHKKIRFDIKSEIRTGGGNSTKDELRAIQKTLQDIETENKLCLCIIDSDKKSPNDSNLGDTAKAVQEVYEQLKSNILVKWICLEVKELENLFPIAWYEQVFTQDKNKNKSLSLLKQLEKHEARKYISMKKGIYLYDILQYSVQDSSLHQYWIEFIQSLEIETVISCLEQLQCLRGKQACTCVIMPGFGTDILIKMIDNCVKERSLTKCNDIEQDELLKLEWERIRQVVTDWCCALPPIL